MHERGPSPAVSKVTFVRNAAKRDSSQFSGPKPIDLTLRVGESSPLYGGLEAVSEHCKRGLRSVRLVGSVCLCADLLAHDAEIALKWLALLKDLASCHVPVSWTCTDIDTRLAARLRHLPPPSVDSRPLWDFRFGAYYWRSGPAFVSVRDSRAEGVSIAHLDGPEFHAFLRCERGVRDTEIYRDDLQNLVDADIVLHRWGFALVLPYRMKHWPVPFRAV